MTVHTNCTVCSYSLFQDATSLSLKCAKDPVKLAPSRTSLDRWESVSSGTSYSCTAITVHRGMHRHQVTTQLRHHLWLSWSFVLDTAHKIYSSNTRTHTDRVTNLHCQGTKIQSLKLGQYPQVYTEILGVTLLAKKFQLDYPWNYRSKYI